MSSRWMRLRFAWFPFMFLCILLGPIAAQVEWTAGAQNPVLDVAPDTWESASVYPYSLMHREGEPYRLWYRGSSVTNWDSSQFWRYWQLGCAQTEDLADPAAWVRDEGGPCMEFDPQGSTWDLGNLGCSVLYDPDEHIYKMWYGGVDLNDLVAVGYATSADGIVWDRLDRPVLKPEEGWDYQALYHVCVLKVGSSYRMWYAGRGDWNNGDTRRIGYATSSNGVDWEKHEGNPVLSPSGDGSLSVFIPQVLFDAETATFEMWYIAGDSVRTTLAYATSLDGVTWTKYSHNPLVIEGEFTSALFNGPILREGDTYRMLYGPIQGNRWVISYASSPWTIPKASFTASAEEGFAPLTIDLDASRSAAPTPPITGYSWDFGDGTNDEGAQVSHTYDRPGEYLLKLTVTGSAGAEGAVARKVSVSFPGGPVDPWTKGDLGKVSAPGDARLDGGCMEILAAVGNIAGTQDSFHFVEQKVQGDFCISGKIADWSASVPGDKVGLMARESLDPHASEVSVVLQKVGTGTEVRLLHRAPPPSSGTSAVRFARPDTWLRLERHGDEFTGSSSTDGLTWSELGDQPVTVPMTAEVLVGVAATAGLKQDARDFAVTRVCDLVLAAPCKVEPSFRRGDATADGGVDITDSVAILGHLFLGDNALDCLDAADVNDDGKNDITDPVGLLGYLFLGAKAPAEPFAACGADPTVDELTCTSFPSCQ